MHECVGGAPHRLGIGDRHHRGCALERYVLTVFGIGKKSMTCNVRLLLAIERVRAV
jgi:hypothetical protein